MDSLSANFPAAGCLLLRSLLLGWVCLSLSGCAVTRPFLKEVGPAPSGYTCALEQANALRDEVTKKRQGLHDFEFWSGAALIGTGIATAGLGAYGANQEALIGTALAAGTIAAGRTYVPVRTRKGIYNTSLEAIEKSKAETSEMKQPSKPTSPNASVVINSVPSSASSSRTLFSMADRLNEAWRLSSAVDEAIKKFNDDRPKLLHEALRTIVATANRALADEVLDPSAALAAATNVINEAKKPIERNQTQALRTLQRFRDLEDVATIMIDQAERSVTDAGERAELKTRHDNALSQLSSSALTLENYLKDVSPIR